MGSVIVIPSDRFESSTPTLSGYHGDYLAPSYTGPQDTIHLYSCVTV